MEASESIFNGWWNWYCCYCSSDIFGGWTVNPKHIWMSVVYSFGNATGRVEQFVDRDVELDQLTDCYESETADFIVIYGRRRLGKSELVSQSIKIGTTQSTDEQGECERSDGNLRGVTRRIFDSRRMT